MKFRVDIQSRTTVSVWKLEYPKAKNNQGPKTQEKSIMAEST